MTPELLTIARNTITRDHRFQPRDHLDRKLVEDYVRLYDEGADLPPLEVRRINGVIVLIDGFHRLVALERLQREFVEVDMTEGTLAEAFKRAAVVNAEHGARRSKKDKIAQIAIAFRYLDALDEPTFDREYRHRKIAGRGVRQMETDGWTHGDIARLVGISLDDVRNNRDAAVDALENKSAILARESGYAARARAARREAAAQRKAERERIAAAAKEAATKAELAAMEAERQEGREALEGAVDTAANPEAIADEVPMPLFHDNYIGKDLFAATKKMLDGSIVWRDLKKEYGEERLRLYILQSPQLQGDLRFCRDGIALVLAELDSILVGLEEVLSVTA